MPYARGGSDEPVYSPYFGSEWTMDNEAELTRMYRPPAAPGAGADGKKTAVPRGKRAAGDRPTLPGRGGKRSGPRG